VNDEDDVRQICVEIKDIITPWATNVIRLSKLNSAQEIGQVKKINFSGAFRCFYGEVAIIKVYSFICSVIPSMLLVFVGQSFWILHFSSITAIVSCRSFGLPVCRKLRLVFYMMIYRSIFPFCCSNHMLPTMLPTSCRFCSKLVVLIFHFQVSLPTT
jgi:hypothetical protein